MKCFLHIGLEKTGTTAVQRFMTVNRETMRSHGILYPKSGSSGFNHDRLAVYAGDDDRCDELRRLHTGCSQERLIELRDRLRANLDSELKRFSGNIVVFSNEHCSSRLTRESEIRRLRDFLRGFFDEIKIIVILRRQDEFLAASFSTAVEHGYTKPFSIMADSLGRYDYMYLLDKWVAHFGMESLLVRIYNKPGEGDPISQILKVIGADSIPGMTDVGRLNESLHPIAIEFLRHMNLRIPFLVDNKVNPSHRALVKAARSADFSDMPVVRNTAAEEFYERFGQSNREVSRRYFDRDDNLFADVPLSRKLFLAPDLNPEQIWDVFARVWAVSSTERIGSTVAAAPANSTQAPAKPT